MSQQSSKSVLLPVRPLAGIMSNNASEDADVAVDRSAAASSSKPPDERPDQAVNGIGAATEPTTTTQGPPPSKRSKTRTSSKRKAASAAYKPQFGFTTIPVIPALSASAKTTSSTYLKSGVSRLFGDATGVAEKGLVPENFSEILVIHPGSRNLRVGRASEAFPKEVPQVIVRKIRLQTPTTTTTTATIASTTEITANAQAGVEGDSATLEGGDSTTAMDDDEDLMEANTDEDGMDLDIENEGEDHAESFDESEQQSSSTKGSTEKVRERPVRDRSSKSGLGSKWSKRGPFPTVIDTPENLELIEQEIRQRMKAKKIRIFSSTRSQVLSYNAQVIPDTILDHNDPYKIEWTSLEEEPEFIVGQQALRMSKLDTPSYSTTSGHYTYRMFHPLQHGLPNTQDYKTLQACMGDLQVIWSQAIETELNIPEKEFSKHNVVLIIPDLFNKKTVREMVSLLLRDMGFRGLVCLQESVAASFGAGISNACVVDIGAQKTSVACVEDAFCVADSRFNLKHGGDDITTVLMSLFLKNDFPYRECDIAKNVFDWMLVDELKQKFCTVNEMELTAQVYDFFVRRPDKQTLLYKVKVYDEVMIAPMSMMYTEVIDFEEKLKVLLYEDTWLEFSTEDEPEEGSSLQQQQQQQPQQPPVAAAPAAGASTSTDAVETTPMTIDDSTT
ncbi:actin-like protein arp8, partial [Quaeritorhiza haematococci]